MKEYIDKAQIKAEIEKLINEIYAGRPFVSLSSDQQIALWYIKSIMSSIDTLEVKEEVLDENDKSKLMQKCVKTAYKRGYDMGVLQTTNKMNHNIKEVNIAEMADEYYDALMKEADWMDEGTMGHCRLAYYNGCKDVLAKLQKGE